MVKNRVKVSVISNFILSAILIFVVAISFIPQSTVPIFNNKSAGAVYNGNKENPNISIMFNVYENTDIVLGILQVLNDYGVRATFFVGGCWADDNENTLNAILKGGNEIGNHGYFHKDHATLNYDKNCAEILNTEKIVDALCGVKTKLFAPPSGSFSSSTLDAASDLGYKVVMWSKDTIDWRDKDKTVLYSRATENLENGDLILMHPKASTLEVLPEILSFYKAKGFGVITVSENIGV